MRRLSERRRKLAASAGSVAAMSGLGGVILRQHTWLRWAWLGLVTALLVWVIVQMVRLNQEEGCR